MNITTDKYTLNNLSKINIILGKNGCGKSTLLKEIEKNLASHEEYGKIKYITPERGGILIYDATMEHNMNSNPSWGDTRRSNRYEQFRQQSVVQFHKFEVSFLRELEKTPTLRNRHEHNFDNIFNKLNSLLDNIQLKRGDKDSFVICKKDSQESINPDQISSGESELISLGMECLVFEDECIANKKNILFLDEPDVHLHPDLQARLAHFLRDLVAEKNAIIILATHSTAMLGELESQEDVNIEFMLSGQKTLDFKKISDEYRKIIPIFGAHPLSNLFNQTPIWLVEGEDDERIWQHAVRTANKKLKIYPCSTDGIDNMSKYEQDVEQIINSVYENAVAFSLRDRDNGNESIDNLKSIKRFKLSCRTSENLILSNEVLETAGMKWEKLKEKIDKWIESKTSHSHYKIMLAFKESNYDRKNFDVKDIRNDLMHLMETSLAWETIIGKTIGKWAAENKPTNEDENSIFSYLGKKLVKELCALKTEK